MLAAVAALSLCAFSVPADAAVLRVVVVETNDISAYMARLAQLRTVMKRLGSPVNMRVWRARYAGPNAGSIVVANEYVDWAAFAADQSVLDNDPEYTALIKGLGSIRKIVSDSLYEELK
jgi:hypothetical protein